METLLSIRDLRKTYPNGKEALKGVTCEVKNGEFVVLIGSSGSGKSTLLRCVNHLVVPTSGTVLFKGTHTERAGKTAIRKIRREIGMIFQHYNLIDRLTVIQNVLHGRLGYKNDIQGILGLYTEPEKEHALEIIDKLGLTDQTYKRCDKLSGGQKQRVGIARALVQDPALILCDEPIASLDPGSAKIIMDHLHSISRDMGISVLVNLHQVDVALKYSDRILGIRGGELVFNDDPEKLKKKMIHDIYGTEDGELVGD